MFFWVYCFRPTLQFIISDEAAEDFWKAFVGGQTMIVNVDQRNCYLTQKMPKKLVFLREKTPIHFLGAFFWTKALVNDRRRSHQKKWNAFYWEQKTPFCFLRGPPKIPNNSFLSNYCVFDNQWGQKTRICFFKHPAKKTRVLVGTRVVYISPGSDGGCLKTKVVFPPFLPKFLFSKKKPRIF